MNRKTSQQSAKPTPRRHPPFHPVAGINHSQAGAYFITICTHNRVCLFGEIVGGEMRLSDAGFNAQQCWNDIPAHFPHAALGEFVIMPNHIHGIVLIAESVGANNDSPLHPSEPSSQRPKGTSKLCGSVVRGFKIGVTKWIRQNIPLDNVLATSLLGTHHRQ